MVLTLLMKVKMRRVVRTGLFSMEVREGWYERVWPLFQVWVIILVDPILCINHSLLHWIRRALGNPHASLTHSGGPCKQPPADDRQSIEKTLGTTLLALHLGLFVTHGSSFPVIKCVLHATEPKQS